MQLKTSPDSARTFRACVLRSAIVIGVLAVGVQPASGAHDPHDPHDSDDAQRAHHAHHAHTHVATAQDAHADHTPITPPPVRAGTKTGQALIAPPDRDEFSFIVFGDRTGGPRSGIPVLRDAVEMTNHLDPAFVMTVGDLIEGYNEPDDWMWQMREYKGIMDELSMPWYPVAGNHDVYARPKVEGEHLARYKEHFGPLYYSFDYKWAHFIVLFSDEMLSFSNPAANQNMSPKQIAWLKEDLASTDAEQIYVFLHHPRWTGGYRGCNWPDVHDIFVEDGRVRAIFAGHIHQYRDDGVRDGIHYYTLAVTGGHVSGLGQHVSFHHIDLMRVTRDHFTLSVLPIGSVLGGDFITGDEVDEIRLATQTAWPTATGAIVVPTEGDRDSTVDIALRNPTDRAVSLTGSIRLPGEWSASLDTFQHTLEPNQMETVSLAVRANVPESAKRLLPRVQVRMTYPLESGLEHTIDRRALLPLRIEGLEAFAAATPERNHALALDGSSAYRVELDGAVDDLREFTLECWAKGPQTGDRTGLVTRTEGSAFGMFWRDNSTPQPAGFVHFRQHGYITVGGQHEVEPNRWAHYALVYDGAHLRFFIDGELVDETPFEGEITPNTMPLYIGADPDGSGNPMSFFEGMIDEVRLSSTARYAGSFSPARLLERDDDTILLYHFDQSRFGFIADDSGNGHHAWPIGEPQLSPATIE